MMYNCDVCLKELTINERFQINHINYCRDHYIQATKNDIEDGLSRLTETEKFDSIQKPEHYHKYEMDTLTFLEKGFPPEVSRGFALGSATKYLHRSELKNGMEDLEKAEFYVKKLIEYKRNEKDPS